MSYSPVQLRARAQLELRRRGLGTDKAARPQFRRFIEQVNPRYAFYRHCEELITVLQRVADGEIQRLMVFMPPRHSKSETVSRLFPAYYLLCHPDRHVGVTSYAADLAYTFSRTARDHFPRAGGRIRADAGAVRHWLTTSGGGLWATGVGGPITGKGFHLGIIDDPLKNADEAASETIRRKQRDWYGSTWSTRREPGAAEILVMTRWNEADLAGELLAQEVDEPEGWYILDLPAIAGEAPLQVPATCTVHPDWREPGEALCPERYTIERLEKIRGRIREYFFGALFQQRPKPRSGGLFSRGHLSIVGTVPPLLFRLRYWDLASAAPGKGDYTVGLLLGLGTDYCWYILDVVRGQWPASERNRMVRGTAARDGQSVPIAIEQPPGLAKEATEALIRELAGYIVHADPVSTDKVSRAEPLAAQAQAGNVFLLAGPWNEAFIQEAEAFPNARHDDQVDGGSGSFNILAAALQQSQAEQSIIYDDRVEISPL